jgi:hypothetical protein
MRCSADELGVVSRRYIHSMIIKIIVLIALIRLLLATQKPFLCSGIYTGVGFFFGLITGEKFLPLILFVAIGFVLSSIYFWLLYRFEESNGLFWLIASLGILLGFV